MIKLCHMNRRIDHKGHNNVYFGFLAFTYNGNSWDLTALPSHYFFVYSTQHPRLFPYERRAFIFPLFTRPFSVSSVIISLAFCLVVILKFVVFKILFWRWKSKARRRNFILWSQSLQVLKVRNFIPCKRIHNRSTFDLWEVSYSIFPNILMKFISIHI